MTASERNGREPEEGEPSGPRLHGDAAAVAASGMPVPSLRVLQGAGAIQAEKSPKFHGGFKRMWREEDVLIAAIGAAISEHFAWNIRLVAEAMSKTRPGTWRALAEAIASAMPAEERAVVIRATEHDWHLDLIDRKFLFLRIPPLATALALDTAFGQTDLILGWATSKDTFQMLPWSLGHGPGRARLADTAGGAAVASAERLYRIAMAAHGNALSRSSINISMQVRAAWRRLHGLDARFFQDAIV